VGDLLHLGGLLLACGAVYGGIRVDLKTMHERLRDNAAATARAHDRLDRHIETFHAAKQD